MLTGKPYAVRLFFGIRKPKNPGTGQDKLAMKPSDLSFERAVAVAVSALTALQAIRDVGRVQSGQDVLIVGASGGVGS